MGNYANRSFCVTLRWLSFRKFKSCAWFCKKNKKCLQTFVPFYLYYYCLFVFFYCVPYVAIQYKFRLQFPFSFSHSIIRDYMWYGKTFLKRTVRVQASCKKLENLLRLLSFLFIILETNANITANPGKLNFADCTQ